MTSNGLREWKITIHSSKTVIILFGDKQPVNLRKIIINDHLISWGNSVKYLGVTLVSTLKFSKHITYIYNKAR